MPRKCCSGTAEGQATVNRVVSLSHRPLVGLWDIARITKWNRIGFDCDSYSSGTMVQAEKQE